jgi:hypothetical protein
MDCDDDRNLDKLQQKLEGRCDYCGVRPGERHFQGCFQDVLDRMKELIQAMEDRGQL